MRVCIVGAGVAGLQVADALSAHAHECHIFDAQATVGGVWRENYDGYALQVPAELYEFPALRHEVADDSFPSGATIQAYIERFVAERDLPARCTFHMGEAVAAIVQLEGGGWCVRTARATYSFDYCVVCTGMYHEPHIPAALATLRPIHTSDFVDASVVQKKRVVVVGGGKSAIDCAVAASKHAASVTLVQRELHWPVPRRILGVLPFQWCTYSRLGHALLPAHWALSPMERATHAFLRPFKHVAWRLMEIVIAAQFGLTAAEYARLPRLEVDLFTGGQILTTELRDALRAGRVRRVFAPAVDGLVSADDVLICGTGFRKNYDIFDDETRSRLDVQPDGLWLYKNILPARVSNLAFVGSEVSTFNNILTGHVQSRWLAHRLAREAPPPLSTHEMLAYVERDRAWKRSWMQPTPSRASLIQLHMTKYHDILMKDMGLPLVKRHWWQWAAPHRARDDGFCF